MGDLAAFTDLMMLSRSTIRERKVVNRKVAEQLPRLALGNATRDGHAILSSYINDRKIASQWRLPGLPTSSQRANDRRALGLKKC